MPPEGMPTPEIRSVASLTKATHLPSPLIVGTSQRPLPAVVAEPALWLIRVVVSLVLS